MQGAHASRGAPRLPSPPAPGAPTATAVATAPKPADNGSATLIARAVKFREVFVASDPALTNMAGHGSPTLIKLRSLAARM